MEALNPLVWIRWCSEFVRGWFVGIPWQDAPKAIPAIVLSIVLFVTGFIAFSGGTGWRNRRLERQLMVSLERDDFPTAEIVIRRQLEADPENLELLHRFAWIRDAQSHPDEAKAIMRKLLHHGHAPAARWLLQNDMIGKKWSDFDEQQLDECGLILELISDADPKDVSVKKMYTDYAIFRHRYSTAVELLLELSETEPLLGLKAAELSRRLGEHDQAELYAAKTLEIVQEMQKDDPMDANLAFMVARNQLFLDRHSDAIRTLKRSLDISQDPKQKQMLTLALGDAIVAYVNFIEQSPTNTVSERLKVLQMLEAAVQIAPNNPRVVTMLADHVLGSLDEQNQEVVTVRNALVRGAPLWISHFIKGTAALMKDDMKRAELHLGLASEQNGKSAAVLNNLAVALSSKQEPDLERALEISNEAINSIPVATPHFYETRGQILYRLGRLREAISDLERALAAPTLELKAHQMLAKCYDEVGDPELAEQHRDAVSRMEREMAAGTLDFKLPGEKKSQGSASKADGGETTEGDDDDSDSAESSNVVPGPAEGGFAAE
ncbi:tetratricopeptide repeat protein [Roseiconus lacunae]|uniref:tetratricopeptide repeat protein n=1 Tax=Roseiconus lacunae TaxID=2605694 RepID=UPI001E3E4089|nr:tetratricopeptide repeat protein [Roseiconus lacunae]MCD0461694.1 tetratricopeptide repeat protein [Roseiconus lacunae]